MGLSHIMQIYFVYHYMSFPLWYIRYSKSGDLERIYSQLSLKLLQTRIPLLSSLFLRRLNPNLDHRAIRSIRAINTSLNLLGQEPLLKDSKVKRVQESSRFLIQKNSISLCAWPPKAMVTTFNTGGNMASPETVAISIKAPQLLYWLIIRSEVVMISTKMHSRHAWTTQVISKNTQRRC